MGKALPCKRCGTDQHLLWKTFAETTHWIVCDRCGRIGPQGDNWTQAGERWNEMNKPEAAPAGE